MDEKLISIAQQHEACQSKTIKAFLPETVFLKIRMQAYDDGVRLNDYMLGVLTRQVDCGAYLHSDFVKLVGFETSSLKKQNIKIPHLMLSRLDGIAATIGLTRSRLIAMLFVTEYCTHAKLDCT